MRKYSLARCELYSNKSHGSSYTPLINGKILCIETIELEEYIEYIQNYLWKDSVLFMLNNIDMKKIQWALGLINGSPHERTNNITKNNFDTIYNRLQYILLDPHFNKVNIIEKIIVPFYDSDLNFENYYTTCIIKTFWIKLIQRSWKKIYSKRKEIIKKRVNINNLHFWQINGKWPDGLNYLPSVKDIKII